MGTGSVMTPPSRGGNGWSLLENPLRRTRFGPMYAIFMVLAVASVIAVFMYLPKERTDFNKFPAEHVYRQGVPVDEVFEELLDRDFRKIVPDYGEWGQPAYLDRKRVGNHGVKAMQIQYTMNVNVSDRIPFNRTLPETRPRECMKWVYHEHLPQASVVVISRNEPWSVLIRTLHSIVDRTHKEFLKELIVVDDASVYPGMKFSFQDKLQYYILKRLPRMVSLIRLKVRHGIVKARLAGARAATGDVLVFLDAHSEVNEGWIRPLLHRIKEDPHVVAQPVIDLIDWDSFEYSPFHAMHFFPMSTFTWAGEFEWLEMSVELMTNRSDDHSKNAKSPMMAGGIFAIDRRYFWEIGSYDERMTGWGGENIEMSVRVWTCGGQIEIIPCSRVGHVFRPRNPQDPDDRNFTQAIRSHRVNLLRTVKVWWDEYERLIFQYRPTLRNLTEAFYGDISERQALRKRLGCRPFEWYLKNLSPMYVMDQEPLHGRIMSDTGLCLWHDASSETQDAMLELSLCVPYLTGKQYFALSREKHLRRELICAVPYPDWRINVTKLRLTLCAYVKSATWEYFPENRTLVFTRFNECLDSVHGAYATLQRCHPHKLSQKWTFLDDPRRSHAEASTVAMEFTQSPPS